MGCSPCCYSLCVFRRGFSSKYHIFCLQVLHDLGLVITIYDILSIEGGFIYPSDGAAHYTVKFRLVVFRPFINEVLSGRLTRCDKYAFLADG